MDEPELDDPQEPGTGQPADPVPADAATPAPPTRGRRLQGALASRAAGWVVAAALAGAVVALSVVLAATPRGLQVRALAGPATITQVPVPPVRVPAAGTRLGQPVIYAFPVPLHRTVCAVGPAPRAFRVILPAAPAAPAAPGGRQAARAIVIKPGAGTLVPVVVCPPR